MILQIFCFLKELKNYFVLNIATTIILEIQVASESERANFWSDGLIDATDKRKWVRKSTEKLVDGESIIQ